MPFFSLQTQHHRAERRVVVKRNAEITSYNWNTFLTENKLTYISL